MAAMIYGQQLSKAFGAKTLFKDITLGISEKDRIGVIGPNGSGKSTLLRILQGEETADQGTVMRKQHLRVAYIPQQATFDPQGTVGGVIEQAARNSGVSSDECFARAQATLGRMGFEDFDAGIDTLSGGWKKRLAIACGFVQQPDVMLLDEPTNHLDVEGMQWLEDVMVQAPWAWMTVSHDRWFLEQATNSILELNSRYPNGFFQVPGSYSEFLSKRAEYQQNQSEQAQALAGQVRREIEWLRRGPKARTTKAKFRVEKAHAMQHTLAETTARLQETKSTIEFETSGRKTKRLITLEHVSKTFGRHRLFHNLELVCSPKVTMGILGLNGSGKSTLLKVIIQAISPDEGTVKHAENLKLVYFDQHREQLDLSQTLRKALSETGHTVTYRDRTMHISAWAKRFQFTQEQLDIPVHLLSGGEQARAAIAQLMLQPADVLILDEPTNDLDIPTLEILEESLRDFPGAVVLVTHDRYMLMKVCNQFLGLDGKGHHGLFADYGQWETWLRTQPGKETNRTSKEKASPPAPRKQNRRSSPKKLTYKEQKEYTGMEERIHVAEAHCDRCRAKSEDPKIASDYEQTQIAYEELNAAEQEVERLYARWAELEAKLQGDASSTTS